MFIKIIDCPHTAEFKFELVDDSLGLLSDFTQRIWKSTLKRDCYGAMLQLKAYYNNRGINISFERLINAFVNFIMTVR